MPIRNEPFPVVLARHDCAMTDDAGGASVEFRWKEEVVYWEGDCGFVFEGGWGTEPPVTYVPDDATWDQVVPAWMKGRRHEIVRRLSAEPGHVVRSTPNYSPDSYREVSRP